MRILVIGDEQNLSECHQKFGDGNTYLHATSQSAGKKFFEASDVLFDFQLDKDRTQISLYRGISIPVFVSVSKMELGSLRGAFDGFLFGFAGLPTFLNREVFELSLSNPDHKEKLTAVCGHLNTAFEIVKDQVGLVTPRVICMIINEAYYTVEEETASREDIDLAMKLGTNYPFGPFEWCQKIGIDNVYELLEAVHQATGDSRYEICPLLKEEYRMRG